ncbi:FAD-dependent monooxygenase [Shewanella sp. JM162201]|uniref:FAD-dependent monooxygenase n=1 Tax=Shewanella jiangmenensis TaxID=2837387 RepID=A0ABS5V4V9_9GAMM|nr:FAD-dependent oxidoreductase [Shewanella jiangmenensis]MBT1444646.1 FAD-dependent monooxygenase [Shewanella jiangmenensis]
MIEQDVVVIGGGMVGAALAAGLADKGLSVTVIESQTPAEFDMAQPLDVRVSALSVASEKLLASLNAWQGVMARRAVTYLGLETWEMDGCITEFHARQIGASHLGHIVENRIVQLALWDALKALPKVTIKAPAAVSGFERSVDTDGIRVMLDSGEVLHTRLLVGADGANSMVRSFANIGVTGWDYAQSAMLINIATECDEQDVTWQQFTPEGPRSLLPLPGKHASLVWYDDVHTINRLAKLNNGELAEAIRANFPSRLDGRFEVLSKGHFKLTRRHAQRYFEPNLVLVGDAAHTINPLAGQGVNLGFKDVTVLLEEITRALSGGECWYDGRVLKRYQDRRWKDNQLMMTTMDAFYAAFSNDLLPLKLIRNAALKLANQGGFIKREVLKYAMGLK